MSRLQRFDFTAPFTQASGPGWYISGLQALKAEEHHGCGRTVLAFGFQLRVSSLETLPGGFALFEEGCEAFVLVLGAAEAAEDVGFGE
jgi:hypothetical protein